MPTRRNARTPGMGVRGGGFDAQRLSVAVSRRAMSCERDRMNGALVGGLSLHTRDGHGELEGELPYRVGVTGQIDVVLAVPVLRTHGAGRSRARAAAVAASRAGETVANAELVDVTPMDRRLSLPFPL